MKLAPLRRLFNSVFRRTQIESEMNDELRFHVEARAEDLMSRGGLSLDEALRQARLEFGGVEKFKEEGRGAWGLRWLDEFRGDVSYALRQFRRTPTFTIVTILTLAIGIGVNTAAFSRLNDALWKSLPVPHPEQLHQLQWSSSRAGFRQGGNSYSQRAQDYETSFSYAAYQHLRDHNTAFVDLFCFDYIRNVNLGLQGRAESAMAVPVSGNYFRGLQIEAMHGRTITPDDDRPDAPPVVVLNYGFWQRAFGGDPSVIGRTLTLNATPALIIGVTPREIGAVIPNWQPDLMVPLSLIPAVFQARDALRNASYWEFNVIGRLRENSTVEQARLESETLLHQAILSASPEREFVLPKVALAPGGHGFNTAGPELSLPMVASALVLLIACANVAGLMLSRARARSREIAARMALGASRRRLVRQLLTESLLLSFAGGCIGIAVAFFGTNSLPRADVRVLMFFLTVSILTGVTFGLIPALRTTRVDLMTMMKRTSIDSITDRFHFRTGKALVSVQVGLSLMLIIGAGLLLQTLSRLKSQDMGIKTENLLTFRMNAYLNGYRDERLIDFYQAVLHQVQGVPGVRTASLSRWGILTHASSGEEVRVPGHEPGSVSTHYVADAYFKTLGIPLLAGRPIDSRDRRGTTRVAVVNEAFVRRFYRGINPLGQRFTLGPQDLEIVGVAGDAKYVNIRARGRATVYVSYQQSNERWTTFAVRTDRDPTALLSTIRQTIATLDPNVPLYDVHTQDEWIELNLSGERQTASLLTFFGAAALLLAAIGIYGTLAYVVSRRTSEIGIRMALGARRVEVMRLVLTESLIPVGIGVVFGLTGAFGLMGGLRSQLFGISPTDPLTLMVATLFLFLTAALAAFVPARRASRIDPMSALRHE